MNKKETRQQQICNLLLERDHLSVPELCVQADRALYEAKRKGRDGYSCYAKQVAWMSKEPLLA